MEAVPAPLLRAVAELCHQLSAWLTDKATQQEAQEGSQTQTPEYTPATTERTVSDIYCKAENCLNSPVWLGRCRTHPPSYGRTYCLECYEARNNENCAGHRNAGYISVSQRRWEANTGGPL